MRFTIPTLLLAIAALLSGSGAALAQPSGITDFDRIFVCNLEDSSFSVLSYPEMKEVARKHVGPRPYYLAINGDNSILAITVEGEESIKFYNAKTYEQLGQLRIGRMYSDHLMTLPDGRRLIISDRYGNAVLLIDFATMKIIKRIEGVLQPHNIRIGATGQFAYVTTKVDPSITVIDLNKGEIRNQFKMKFIPRGLAPSPDEKLVYCGANWVNSIFEYDAHTGKLLKVISTEPPKTAPIVQESTYHGLEFFNDSLLMATNEGNSTLDLINVRTGRLVDRSTNVNGPGAISLLGGGRGELIFTNMGDNTIVLAKIGADQKFQMVKSAKTGDRVGELPKRFTFANR
ncbi:MAG TPA: YncE family protein [Candidatus Kapabacteria bacterium]|jgi:DNA-binding beta-propeller fold protein YncE|nr:YncE family protein [Candidatus Kapabacteria bacterium]